MIEMRENRYDDIRKGVVDRSREKQQPAAPEGQAKQPAEPKKDGKNPDRENYEEYNSWS